MSSILAILFSAALTYAISGFIGLLLNICLLVMIFRERKNISPFHQTLFSLTFANFVSDVCFAVLGTVYTYHLKTKIWTFRSVLLLGNMHLANRYLISVSFFHIIFIAIQRFVAVQFPFRFRRMFTTKLVLASIIFIWIISPTLTTIDYFVIHIKNHTDIILSHLIFIFGLALILLYPWILFRLIKQRRIACELANNNATGPDNSLKLFFNCLGITVAFLCLTFPFAISVVGGKLLANVRLLFSSFIAMKTVTDPLMYFFITKCCALLLRQRNERNVKNAGNHTEGGKVNTASSLAQSKEHAQMTAAL